MFTCKPNQFHGESTTKCADLQKYNILHVMYPSEETRYLINFP